MTGVRFRLTIGILFSLGALCGCGGQTHSRMDIDPRAHDALHKMSKALGRAKSFAFQTTAYMDEPIGPSQLAQSTRRSQVVVHRPDRTFVETRQGDDVWQLWYRDGVLTLLDNTAKVYATVKVPGSIDRMLEDVAKNHGLTIPLADLLFDDPYKLMTAYAQTGRYVGLFEVDGVKCHHLLFTQELLDWQIWIDAGNEPLPRKIAIDYKCLPQRPQFTAMLSDWNLSAPAGDAQFKPVLPNDAKKIELAQLLAEEVGG